MAKWKVGFVILSVFLPTLAAITSWATDTAEVLTTEDITLQVRGYYGMRIRNQSCTHTPKLNSPYFGSSATIKISSLPTDPSQGNDFCPGLLHIIIEEDDLPWGDYDFDGDVDLSDYAIFMNSFTGPK